MLYWHVRYNYLPLLTYKFITISILLFSVLLFSLLISVIIPFKFSQDQNTATKCNDVSCQMFSMEHI